MQQPQARPEGLCIICWDPITNQQPEVFLHNCECRMCVNCGLSCLALKYCIICYPPGHRNRVVHCTYIRFVNESERFTYQQIIDSVSVFARMYNQRRAQSPDRLPPLDFEHLGN